MLITIFSFQPQHHAFEMIRIVTHSRSGPPGGLLALRWWWLSHQQGWRGGPWGEGNTAPHLDHVSQGLEALVTAPLYQQGHGEVACLEPLTHLHCGERTWWGREKGGRDKLASHTLWSSASLCF